MPITMNGTTFPVLTYAAVKSSKDIIDALAAPGMDNMTKTEAAVAFLHLSVPDADLDQCSPGAILSTAVDLFAATFSRPENVAPVQ